MEELLLHMSLDTLTPLLLACTEKKDLLAARQLHTVVVGNGLQGNLKLGCQMISMFASCGNVAEAHKVFSNLLEENVYTWTALISGYAHYGPGEQALILYHQMQSSGMKCSSYTFVAVLKACVRIKSIAQGRLIHTNISRSGFESDLYVASALMDMYSKLGNLKMACEVFDKVHRPDEVIWNTLIAAHAEQACGQEALQLFEKMQHNGIAPSKVTFASVLKACGGMEALDNGKGIHTLIVYCGLNLDMFVGNSLVDMYAKCGSLEDAHEVFKKLPEQNVVSYATLMQGYAEHGSGQGALELFKRMQEEGMKPDSIAFVCVLKACTTLEVLDQGKLLHKCIIEYGLEKDLCVGNSLIDMYSKCGSLEDAVREFAKLSEPDVISWNAMIAGYVEHEFGQDALQCYDKMCKVGIKPNDVTYMCALKACASITALEQGKLIHADIRRDGIESHPFIKNTLIDMYAKCASLEDALKIFTELPERDVVSWSAIIAGYVEHGHGQEALKLFGQMEQEGVEPNKVTYVCILQACSNVAALDMGRLIHINIAKRGIELVPIVGNTLVDMYAKCGNLEEAEQIFHELPRRDGVSWSVMIAGYAQHGHSHTALQYFENMKLEGLKPDDVIFLNILCACSHAGLLEQAKGYFKSMTGDYSLIPTVQHYVCMVDLLGRAGLLKEAEDLIIQMPHNPDAVVWISLLGACAKYNNMEVGQRAFASFVSSDPKNAAGYKLMANIYAANLMWEKAEQVHKMITC